MVEKLEGEVCADRRRKVPQTEIPVAGLVETDRIRSENPYGLVHKIRNGIGELDDVGRLHEPHIIKIEAGGSPVEFRGISP